MGEEEYETEAADYVCCNMRGRVIAIFEDFGRGGGLGCGAPGRVSDGGRGGGHGGRHGGSAVRGES